MRPTMARFLTLLVLLMFAVLGFTPIPGTTLVMIYVVLFRPRWFKRLVDLIYADTPEQANPPAVMPALTDPSDERQTDKKTAGKKTS